MKGGTPPKTPKSQLVCKVETSSELAADFRSDHVSCFIGGDAFINDGSQGQ